MAELIALRYVGEGAFRPSLPARDLDQADIATTAGAQKRSVEELVAEALGSGLYHGVYAEPIAVGAAWEGMTKAQLLAYAAEHGVEVDPKATNAVIRAALAAAAGTPADEATMDEVPTTSP